MPTIAAFDAPTALAGGALLGLSAFVLALLLGRFEGVSGIAAGLLEHRRLDWRATYVVGLIATGAIAQLLVPERFGEALSPSIAPLALAGVLVGFGTRMGNGCTSGHGITGLARGSLRSLVATVSFILAGATTVALTGWYRGLAS